MMFARAAAALMMAVLWAAPALAADWRPEVSFGYAEPTLPATAASQPYYLEAGFADPGSAIATLGYDSRTLEGVYLKWPQATLVNGHTYLASPERYFIEVTAEGQALEGHATITFLRVTGDRVAIDGAFGLFSLGGPGDFTPSFLLYRGDAFRIACDREQAAEDEDTPSPAEAFAERRGMTEPKWSRGCYRKPAPAELEALRASLTGFFGPLPHALAARLLTDPGDSTFFSVDADDYAIKLAGMRARMPAAPKVVDAAYARGAFQDDWRAAANLLCMNLYPLDCHGAGADANLWPQAHFRTFLAGHRSAVRLGGADLLKFEADGQVLPLRIVPADASPPVDDLICPVRWRPYAWGAAGADAHYAAFKGRTVDGYPEGEGTLFLGSNACETLRQSPDGQARLHTTFVRGVPTGPFELYNAIGKLVLAGTVRDGLLDGEVHRYGDFGTEVSSARYSAGRLADGEFTYYQLDYFISALAPPPARQFFHGKIAGGDLTGAWTDLIIALGPEGERVGLYKGRETVELTATESISGPVVPDFESRRYRFVGEGEYEWATGARLIGRFDATGEIRGRARYYDPRRRRWFDTTVQPNGQFTWTYVKRTRRPWYENVGPELKRWVDTAVDQVSRGGHGFEHFMCRLTGTEEGRNCSVSAGVQSGPEGPVLTDGSGVPSAVPLQEDVNWSERLDWAHASELQDAEHGDDSLSPFFADIRDLRVGRAPSDLSTSLWSPLIYMGAPTVSGEERNDAGGKGHFLSPRRNDNGTRRVHLGRDYLAAPGDPILAPMDGVVTVARFEAGNIYRCFIQIINSQGRAVEISYVQPLGASGPGPARLRQGDYVTRGTLIGHAVDIHPTYNASVGNHVHVQYSVPSPSGRGGGWWVSHDGETWVSRQPKP